MAARHSAFTRGSAYLERYCLLIAFGAYLEEVTAGMEGGLAAWKDDTLPSFADWLGARPELQQVGWLAPWAWVCGPGDELLLAVQLA